METHAGGIVAYPEYADYSGNVNRNANIVANGSQTVNTFWGLEKGFISATDISFNAVEKTIYLGDTIELVPVLSPAETSFKKAQWFTSDNQVVTVSDGLVKAVGAGKATIRAYPRYGTQSSAECEIIVIDPNVSPSDATKVILSTPDWQTEGVMGVGETKRVTATVISETAPDQQLTWSSSNPNIVQVDQTGNASAIAAGNATIYATAKNGVQESFAIRVPRAYIECLDQPSHNILRGDPLEINARILMDRPLQKGNRQFILYTAYNTGNYSTGWEEIASFDIDGEELFDERYSGKAAVTDISVSGNVATIKIIIDTGKLPKLENKILMVSVFPYDDFSTGGSLHDYQTYFSLLTRD